MNDKSQVKSEPVEALLKAARCLYLELPVSIAEDVDERVKAVTDQITTLQAQLTLAHKERDDLSAQAAVMRLVLEDIATDDLDRVSGGVKQSAQQALSTTAGTALLERVSEITKERDDAVAACASIRNSLREYSENGFIDHLTVANVLSTDCGTALLARLKEAEWLLSQPLLAKMSDQSLLLEWHRRRDEFRNGMKEGDVK